jgi:hypothetical protein
MLRVIIGVVAGLLTGLVVIATIESIGHMLFPPQGVNLTDPAALRTALDLIPHEAKVFIVLGWFLGVLAGVAVACLIAGRRALAGRVAAGVFALFLAWTLATLDYPLWMSASAVAAAAGGGLLALAAFGRPRRA